MLSNEYHNRIRFSLNDESGVLRFETVDIDQSPECVDVENKIRTYLVGRPLAEVDLDYLREQGCLKDGACIHAVIDKIKEHQCLFVEHGENGAC